MKNLRFLQPNQINAETLNDPAKCKAYFDWKYENFEEEYKIYCEEKRKLLNEFLNRLPIEKKEYYLKRREEFYNEFFEISSKYNPIINKAVENKDIVILEKVMDEEHTDYDKLKEKYKDIEFMFK